MKILKISLILSSVISLAFCASQKGVEELNQKLNILTEQVHQLSGIVQDQLSAFGGNALDSLVNKAQNSLDKDGNLEDFKNKSGFLLGTTLAIREFSAEQIIHGFEQLSQTTPSLQVGIVLGYQHYFNKVFGIRLEGFFDASGKAKIEHRSPLIPLRPALHSGEEEPLLQQISSSPAVVIQDIAQTYLPLKASAEVAILVDFYTKDRHSAGFSLGVGYEAAWYILTKASAKISGSNAEVLKHVLQKPKDLLDSSLYSAIGLHYYYGKHQFELKYKFGKYAFVDSAKSWIFDANGVAIPTTTKLSISSDISINYTYRF